MNDLLPLDMQSGSSGLLDVDWSRWLITLQQSERKGNLGCLGFLFVGVVLPASGLAGPGYGFLVLLSCFLGGLLFIFIRVRRYGNLRDHGRYRYEVYPNKVVRFSDRNFHVLELTELSAVQDKAYGLVLIKKDRIRNGWLGDGNPDILVVPRSIRSYPAVREYVLKKYAGLSQPG